MYPYIQFYNYISNPYLRTFPTKQHIYPCQGRCKIVQLFIFLQLSEIALIVNFYAKIFRIIRRNFKINFRVHAVWSESSSFARQM